MSEGSTLARATRRHKGAPALLLALATMSCGLCGPPPLDESDMDRLAEAFGAAVIDCNPRSDFEQALEPEDPRDREAITANFRGYFRLLLADENVAEDRAAFESCLAFLEGEGRCDEGFADDEEGDCDRVFAGTLPGGARCALRDECQSDVCIFGGASACGTCADDAEGGVGEFCGVRVCEDGLFCTYGHPDGATCQPLRGAGEACFEEVSRVRVFFRCDDGLGCAGDDLCYALAGEGESCAGAKKCDDGLLCDAATETCAAELTGEAAGDRCDPAGRGCGETLDTGLACAGEPGAEVCTPVAIADEGEPCDWDNDEHATTAVTWCARGLSTHYCHALLGGGAECRPRPGVGEDCRGRPCQRESGGCVSSDGGQNASCVAWPALGEDCLVEGGAPTCGPDRFCDNGSGGAVCTSSPLPTALPTCG